MNNFEIMNKISTLNMHSTIDVQTAASQVTHLHYGSRRYYERDKGDVKVKMYSLMCCPYLPAEEIPSYFEWRADVSPEGKTITDWLLYTPRNEERYSWKKNDGLDWKERYTKLYSSKGLALRKDDDDQKLNRISFMSNDRPYQSLMQQDGLHRDSPVRQASYSSALTVMSSRSEGYGSIAEKGADGLGGHETKLLEMVRARNRELVEEHQDKTLVLPRDDTDEEEETSDGCAHGISMRMTERSISRSRVSRMSTRRDMDIPSILAFTTHIAPSRTHLGIPAFQKTLAPKREELPRFSIRRAVCPVCSQKWKDRSSISNVKSSGLKRSTAAELPSVIAPARLRTSITLGYVPRPTLAAVDEEVGLAPGGFRNSRSSTAWQLTRARRYRLPKPQMPLAENVAPTSSAAPLRRKDLDQRVSQFLNDTTNKKSLNVI